MTHLRILLIAAACAAGALACDRPEPAADQVAQQQKAHEGTAWRDLLRNLDGAADDEARIGFLERFLTNHADHPDAPEAKRRLEELRADPEANARVLVADVAKKAVAEGLPQDLIALFAAESVRLSSARYERDALASSVDVPTSAGVKIMDKGLFLHPLVLRGQVRNALRAHMPQFPERCDRSCVNEQASALFQKAAGGPLFVEDGKMNPDAVGPLLEKAWIAPETALLGLPASRWFAIFAPTFRAYAQIGHAMKAADPAAAAAKLAGFATPAEVADYYGTYSTELKLAEKSGLEPRDARAIAGWWLRRYADGTAPLFDAFATKVREAYDPELALP